MRRCLNNFVVSAALASLVGCSAPTDRRLTPPHVTSGTPTEAASAPVASATSIDAQKGGASLTLEPMDVGRLQDFPRYPSGIARERNGNVTLGTSVAVHRVGAYRDNPFVVLSVAFAAQPDDDETTILSTKNSNEAFQYWQEIPARLRIGKEKGKRRVVAGRFYGAFFRELALSEGGEGPFDLSWRDYRVAERNEILPTSVVDVAYYWSERQGKALTVVAEESGRISTSRNNPVQFREVRTAEDSSCPAGRSKVLDLTAIDATFYAARYDCAQNDLVVLERFDEDAEQGVVIGPVAGSGLNAPLPKPWLESDSTGLLVLLETPRGSKAFRVDPASPGEPQEVPFPKAHGILAFQMIPPGALAIAARQIDDAPPECTAAKGVVVATRDLDGAWWCLKLLASERPQLRGLVQAHDGTVYVAIMDEQYSTLYSTREDLAFKFKPPRTGAE